MVLPVGNPSRCSTRFLRSPNFTNDLMSEFPPSVLELLGVRANVQRQRSWIWLIGIIQRWRDESLVTKLFPVGCVKLVKKDTFPLINKRPIIAAFTALHRGL